MSDPGYVVEYNEDQGSMQFLYDLTNIFLRPIISNDLFPEEFLTTDRYPDLNSLESLPNDVIKDIGEVLDQNKRFIVAVGFGIFFAVLSFLMLIGFCCTCCCCKSKSSSGKAKRILIIVSMVIVIIFGYLGVAWMDVSSVQMDKGSKRLPENLENILHDTDLYVNVTVDQIKDVFNDTVGVFNNEIDKIDVNFNTFVDNLMVDIKISDMNSSVNDMLELFDEYDVIVGHMNLVIDNKNNITSIAGTISTQCSGLLFSECSEIKNLTDAIANLPLQKLDPLSPDLKDKLNEVSEVFNRIPEEIENLDISGILSDLKDQVNSITGDFDEALDPINDIQESIRNISTTQISDFIENYTKWVNVGFLSVGGFLIFIITLVVLSIFCGACNKHGRSSCGSRTLCCSLSIFFAAAIFLFILCAALFTVGAMSQKIVCDSLDKPGDSQLIMFINPFINNFINENFNSTENSIILDGEKPEEIVFNISIPEIIVGIHRGDPIYPLLQLNNVFDINTLENWREDFDIDSIIVSVMNGIEDAIKVVTDIEEDIPRENITKIVEAFDAAINPILQNILDETLINELIQTSIDQISDIINTLTNAHAPSELITSLEKLKSEMRQMLQNIRNVQNDFIGVIENFGNPPDEMNLTGFTNEVFALVDNAFDTIPTSVRTFVNETIEGLLTAVDNQIPVVVNSINNEIGATTPLGNIYDATYTNICLELVSPLNSIWSGLGWTLLLIMFPLTILSCFFMKILGAPNPEDHMGPYSNRNRTLSMHDIAPPPYQGSQTYEMRQYGNQRQYNNNNNIPRNKKYY